MTRVTYSSYTSPKEKPSPPPSPLSSWDTKHPSKPTPPPSPLSQTQHCHHIPHSQSTIIQHCSLKHPVHLQFRTCRPPLFSSALKTAPTQLPNYPAPLPPPLPHFPTSHFSISVSITAKPPSASIPTSTPPPPPQQVPHNPTIPSKTSIDTSKKTKPNQTKPNQKQKTSTFTYTKKQKNLDIDRWGGYV